MASSNIEFDINVSSSVDSNSNNTKTNCHSNMRSGEQVCIYNVSGSLSVDTSPSVLSYGFIPLQELSRILSYAHNTQTHITDYVQLHKILQNSHTPNCMSHQLIVPSGLNINKWEEYLQGYWDHQAHIFLKIWLPSRHISHPAISGVQLHSQSHISIMPPHSCERLPQY